MVIGLIVLLSGCTGNQEKNIAQTPQSTPTQSNIQTTVVQSNEEQTPATPYQVQVTEVKTLQDCIVSTVEKSPCLLINLQVKNNNAKSLHVQIIKEDLVSKSARKLGIRYDKNVGLSNLCIRQSGLEFILDANTEKNIGMCYPAFKKSDNPILNLGTIINNERKDYGFDLTKYILAD